MKPDYLWDRSGEPDPELQRLERVLGGLGFRGGELQLPDEPAPVAPPRGRPHPWRFWLSGLAAAVLLLWSGLQLRGARAGWTVQRLTGAPRVGSATLDGQGRLRVRDWLETDAGSSARVQIGSIGEVEVAPNTRVQLTAADPTAHGLKLERGRLSAKVKAPPRLFFVDTPAAKAWDLGCAYELEVDARGDGLLHVTQGFVELDRGGVTAYVPWGARCRISAERGPGTPYFPEAEPMLIDVLGKIDSARASPETMAEAIAIVCRVAGERDTLSLWNLLPRVDRPERALLFDRIAVLLPMMRGIDRERVLAADAAMLQELRDQLGLLWF